MGAPTPRGRVTQPPSYSFSGGPQAVRNQLLRAGVDPSFADFPASDILPPQAVPEVFHQSFTGVDFKITAIMPFGYDTGGPNSSEYAKIVNKIAALQLQITHAAKVQQAGGVLTVAFVEDKLKPIAQQIQSLERHAVQLTSKRSGGPFFKTFGEIQTLSMTSRRSVSPVRRLGEATPAYYTKGPRTIAGSLVFIFLEEDVLLDIYRKDRTDANDGEPYFVVDRLPPFNILITGINEYGHVVEGGLYGVTLMASGMTLSIDDLFTEQQFTYVARWMMPMARRDRMHTTLNFLGRTLPSAGRGRVSDLEPSWPVARIDQPGFAAKRQGDPLFTKAEIRSILQILRQSGAIPSEKAKK